MSISDSGGRSETYKTIRAGIANGQTTAALLGTNPAIDREEAKVDRLVKSICGVLIV